MPGLLRGQSGGERRSKEAPMPDALAVLAEDHRHVLQLLEQLTSGSGEPNGETRERKALAEQVAIAESKHEAIEELCFWPVVRQRLEDGEQLAARALGQEQEGKELIHDLDHVTAGVDEFTTLVQRLQSEVRDHITFEESQVWPRLRLTLTDEELEEMGAALVAAKRTAPTRPHPKTPPDPRVLATVGPAVGMIDRARDLAVGRGRGVQGTGRARKVLVALAVGVPLAGGGWVLRRMLAGRRHDASAGTAAATAVALGAVRRLTGRDDEHRDGAGAVRRLLPLVALRRLVRRRDDDETGGGGGAPRRAGAGRLAGEAARGAAGELARRAAAGEGGP